MRRIALLVSLGLLVGVAMAAPKRSISGTWMVTVKGKPNPNMKLIFTPNGEFKFAGANYSSSGTYKVVDNTVRLVWTKVDGQSVKPGTMKRTLKLGPSNTFKIDQYTYKKVK